MTALPIPDGDVGPSMASELATTMDLSPSTGLLQQPAIERSNPRRQAPVAEALLLIYADSLDDLEHVRIGMANRILALTTDPTLSEAGRAFGKGLPSTSPAAERLGVLIDGVKALESAVTLDLKRAMKAHPLNGWVERNPGVGEKQAARLLAAIGNPATRRTVSQLWAYCGLHVLSVDQRTIAAQRRDVDGTRHPDQRSPETHSTGVGVAPSRTKGQRNNWNAKAKSRVWLVAEKCVMFDGKPDKNGKPRARSPYRDVYDTARQKYANVVHSTECRQCGQKGQPAPAGSPLSAGHQQARAYRIVCKEILKDLWLEARAVYTSAEPRDGAEAVIARPS